MNHPRCFRLVLTHQIILFVGKIALIHDVDHRGVSNMQLAVEAPEMAERYDKKSVAEQNSLDLSWDILMEDRFCKLRSFVFGSQEELLRFRQLIVNMVLATGECSNASLFCFSSQSSTG